MKIALVDERMPKDAKRRLELDGFYTLDVPKSKRLPEPVSAHPDMVLFHHEKTIISSAEYCDEFPYFFEDLTKLIPGITLELTDGVFAESYPHDAIFNALVINNVILTGIRHTDNGVSICFFLYDIVIAFCCQQIRNAG